MNGDIVGVVLGAGASTRLRRPKQTLPYGDTTLLGWCVREAEASSLDRVIVVLGGQAAAAARAAVNPTRAVAVDNDGYGTGCASSLLAGLDAAGDAARAIVMLLGDMPGVSRDVIDTVVAAWRHRPTWAAITEYDGRVLGHPLVFSAAAFPTLRSLHGDKAVWKVVDTEPEQRVRRIRVPGPLPLDVDTWDDYARILRASAGSGDEGPSSTA